MLPTVKLFMLFACVLTLTLNTALLEQREMNGGDSMKDYIGKKEGGNSS